MNTDAALGDEYRVSNSFFQKQGDRKFTTKETKQRLQSQNEPPTYDGPLQAVQYLPLNARNASEYVEHDDDLYIDSDELSDDIFRSVEAFSDDEIDYPMTIPQAAQLIDKNNDFSDVRRS